MDVRTLLVALRLLLFKEMSINCRKWAKLSCWVFAEIVSATMFWKSSEASACSWGSFVDAESSQMSFWVGMLRRSPRMSGSRVIASLMFLS